ncbi:MAG: ATP-binding cassette domain-containing protein [Gemmatimonadota bacterium]|nr:ATP-binding cassette domain-containing protein [Gemmatimonadota bacterium]
MNWRVRVCARAGSFALDAAVAGDGAPVALIGPNGSGKTILLRAISGGHPPVAGRIRVGGRILYDSDAGVRLAPERRRIGYVPQGYGIFPHLNVLENVAFGLAAARPRQPRGDRRAAAAALLGEMDCAHLARRLPATLSGGEKQRVALARALLAEPDLLLLDEPLAALDAAARRDIRRFLAGHLATRNTPALVVTHDARDVRALGARSVYVLEGGSVIQRGAPESLAASPATEFVREFFG